jgi:hypothetical protein
MRICLYKYRTILLRKLVPKLRNSFKKTIEFTFLGLVVIAIATGCAPKEAVLEFPDDTQIPVTIGNDGIKAGIAGDITEKTTSITVEIVGRADPFVPDASGFTGGYYISADMIAPPDDITPSANASDVITTKVTGILYDANLPSAIINISGSDYLVRNGDYINNYKVLSIGQKSVTVKLGNNIYKAGVGELFTKDGMNYNTISNLEDKFGGSKR